MTLTHAYATTSQVSQAIGLVGNYDNETLEVAINAASRQIDGYCGQRFWLDENVVTRYFTAEDGYVDLSDGGIAGLASTDDLVVATDEGLLTYGTTWTANDYRLLPLNAAADGWPWTSLEASPIGSLWLPSHMNAVKITGKFGWATVPDDVVQACILQAAQLYKAKDAAFGIVSFGVEGSAMRVGSKIHSQAAGLLAPYRRPAVG